MKLISSFAYNRVVSNSFKEEFSVDRAGMYAIEITASAKSWWQNAIARRSFLLKDSLTIGLDVDTIIPLPKRKKLLADDLWNGNVLKNNELTVYLIAYLKAEPHVLSFTARGSPFIKDIAVYALENNAFELKQITPRKRDRIPWLTFLIGDHVSLALISISARATKPQSGDDDDLALRVDGGLVRNDERRAHREWHWCGKALKGGTKIFVREFGANESPSRIDLVADGMPTIESLFFALRMSRQRDIFSKPHLYKAGPYAESYNRYDDVIAEIVHEWNNEFSNKRHPVPKPLDPSLVKAIAYVESRIGYGADTVGYPAYPDIMQVGDTRNPAIHVLRSEKGFEEHEWDDDRRAPAVMVFDKRVQIKEPRESIYWGVRWLYHKAQYIDNNQRKWRSWEKAVEGYHKKGDTAYKNHVMKVYRQGVDRNGTVLWTFVILGLLAFGGQLAIGIIQHNTRGVDTVSHEMRNAEYSINGKIVKLHNGAYRFLPKQSDKALGINPYDFETGPYSVSYERGIAGDLNGDGARDGIAVLSLNYGGTGSYIHVAALIAGADGTYHHSGSVVYGDRDGVNDVSFDNGIVRVASIVHGDDDPLCCPTTVMTKQFTIEDFESVEK